ncbi:MAG: NAD(P)/FAD-dependent oxidoreductase [Pseudomonadota bacterium]
MTNPDIVIVGAGAAGIGAALELQERGVSHLILEAAGRVGGRAYTDATSLPVPWDHGCHWLHCADVNPLVAWADKLGVDYLREEWVDHFQVWTDGAWEAKTEVDAARATLLDAYEVIEAAGEGGDERPMSALMPDLGRWNRAVPYIMALLHSEDPGRISCVGVSDYDETDLNWPVIEGYGELIRRMSEGLSIHLGVRVAGVAETPSRTKISTDQGDLEAKGAIITASTNVINSGAISIGPGPARDLLDFIADVPCGAYEKVAISLSRPLVTDQAKRFAMVDPGPPQSPLDFQIVQKPAPMMIAHMGGDLAREWVKAGAEARKAFALERLEMAFGREARDAVTGVATTNWLENPNVLGAYSYAVPGAGQRRHEMIAADTGRIAFAGEAFSKPWQATAHGAYQSGRDVAARICAHI